MCVFDILCDFQGEKSFISFSKWTRTGCWVGNLSNSTISQVVSFLDWTGKSTEEEMLLLFNKHWGWQCRWWHILNQMMCVVMMTMWCDVWIVMMTVAAFDIWWLDCNDDVTFWWKSVCSPLCQIALAPVTTNSVWSAAQNEYDHHRTINITWIIIYLDTE